ncbi:MAG: L-seryl-tRNA(Sec) selenium transferase [Candidatus Aminicenantales bacterium]
MKETRLRQIPSIDSLLSAEAGQKLIGRFGRDAFLKTCRAALDEFRDEILSEKSLAPGDGAFSQESLFRRIEDRLNEKFSFALEKAVNATGILMHSGLGRAVLPEAARQALDEASRGYCTLALDLETGRRGQRDFRVSRLLAELTGAEAATLVNNNAAATVLVLHALARGKDVIVSRGQLVEIGGSFRMPDVMSASGAVLREVGTTNKTHLRDYAAAISGQTGAILRVHHSNYRIVGFHEEPEIEELVELGAKHDIPVIDDLGSGALVDLREFGLATEPMVRRSVQAGVVAACFSGDKLIGGPQSGLIVGKAEYVDRVKKDPLARAFRCGKLTIAAMEATLKLFLAPDLLKERHPLYRMLSWTVEELQQRARRVERRLKKSLPADVRVSVVDGGSQVGSGSVPVETIPTKMLAIASASLGPDDIGRALRLHKPRIFSRIHKDAVLFDFRTIQPDEDEIVKEAIEGLFLPS